MLKRFSFLVLAVVTLAIAGCGGGDSVEDKVAPDVTEPTPTPTPKPTKTQQELVAGVERSVVQIFGRIGEGYAGGTGVVIDAKEGLILTNDHVVSGMTAMKARSETLKPTPVQVVGRASCDDLALVKFGRPQSGVEQMELGSSAGVQRGDHVTALGFPASFQEFAEAKMTAVEGSVAVVDISAAPDVTLPNYESLIQHQAPTNPGNSGGPLVDDYGLLIGINTLGNDSAGGRPIENQNYSIAVDHVKRLLPDLRSGKDDAYVGWRLTPVSVYTPQSIKNYYKTEYDTEGNGLFVEGLDTALPQSPVSSSSTTTSSKSRTPLSRPSPRCATSSARWRRVRRSP